MKFKSVIERLKEDERDRDIMEVMAEEIGRRNLGARGSASLLWEEIPVNNSFSFGMTFGDVVKKVMRDNDKKGD